MGDIRLFVSHSHDDKEIAAALVDVIEATMVPRERILCTSHDNPKYRYPKRVDVSRYLRDHLTQSSCVLGLLTPNSIKSPWCLFELGGAWALATRTYLQQMGLAMTGYYRQTGEVGGELQPGKVKPAQTT